MANALYDKGREGFLAGDLDWDGHVIKACLVDLALYAPNLATDEFLDDIAVGARVSISGAFTGKTVAAGVADADDATFTLVPAGDPCEAIVIFRDTGDPATSRLIAYIDVATGLPVTPNGGDIIVRWSAGANRIFKL